MSALWDLLFSLFCGAFGPLSRRIPAGKCRTPASDYIVCSYAGAGYLNEVLLSMMPTANLMAVFSQLEPELADQSPKMLMNGGMYHDDLERGWVCMSNSASQLKGISTKGGWGNFHLLPNGVFWVRGGRQAGVTETKTISGPQN